jgi:hypothetical protein
MSKLKIAIISAFFLFSIALTQQACNKSNNCDDSKTSAAGGDDSHNNGQNCMTCHASGGKGEGCFNVAGSVYDNAGTAPVNAGTVKLYTGPNGTGTLVTTLQVDGKGNFYTSEAVNFSGGVYPAYSNSSGTQTSFMGSSIGIGACGSCHGNSTGKITAP